MATSSMPHSSRRSIDAPRPPARPLRGPVQRSTRSGKPALIRRHFAPVGPQAQRFGVIPEFVLVPLLVALLPFSAVKVWRHS